MHNMNTETFLTGEVTASRNTLGGPGVGSLLLLGHLETNEIMALHLIESMDRQQERQPPGRPVVSRDAARTARNSGQRDPGPNVGALLVMDMVEPNDIIAASMIQSMTTSSRRNTLDRPPGMLRRPSNRRPRTDPMLDMQTLGAMALFDLEPRDVLVAQMLQSEPTGRRREDFYRHIVSDVIKATNNLLPLGRIELVVPKPFDFRTNSLSDKIPYRRVKRQVTYRRNRRLRTRSGPPRPPKHTANFMASLPLRFRGIVPNKIVNTRVLNPSQHRSDSPKPIQHKVSKVSHDVQQFVPSEHSNQQSVFKPSISVHHKSLEAVERRHMRKVNKNRNREQQRSLNLDPLIFGHSRSPPNVRDTQYISAQSRPVQAPARRAPRTQQEHVKPFQGIVSVPEEVLYPAAQNMHRLPTESSQQHTFHKILNHDTGTNAHKSQRTITRNFQRPPEYPLDNGHRQGRPQQNFKTKQEQRYQLDFMHSVPRARKNPLPTFSKPARDLSKAHLPQKEISPPAHKVQMTIHRIPSQETVRGAVQSSQTTQTTSQQNVLPRTHKHRDNSRMRHISRHNLSPQMRVFEQQKQENPNVIKTVSKTIPPQSPHQNAPSNIYNNKDNAEYRTVQKEVKHHSVISTQFPELSQALEALKQILPEKAKQTQDKTHDIQTSPINLFPLSNVPEIPRTPQDLPKILSPTSHNHNIVQDIAQKLTTPKQTATPTVKTPDRLSVMDVHHNRAQTVTTSKQTATQTIKTSDRLGEVDVNQNEAHSVTSKQTVTPKIKISGLLGVMDVQQNKAQTIKTMKEAAASASNHYVSQNKVQKQKTPTRTDTIVLKSLGDQNGTTIPLNKALNLTTSNQTAKLIAKSPGRLNVTTIAPPTIDLRRAGSSPRPTPSYQAEFERISQSSMMKLFDSWYENFVGMKPPTYSIEGGNVMPMAVNELDPNKKPGNATKSVPSAAHQQSQKPVSRTQTIKSKSRLAAISQSVQGKHGIQTVLNSVESKPLQKAGAIQHTKRRTVVVKESKPQRNLPQSNQHPVIQPNIGQKFVLQSNNEQQKVQSTVNKHIQQGVTHHNVDTKTHISKPQTLQNPVSIQLNGLQNQFQPQHNLQQNNQIHVLQTGIQEQHVQPPVGKKIHPDMQHNNLVAASHILQHGSQKAVGITSLDSMPPQRRRQPTRRYDPLMESIQGRKETQTHGQTRNGHRSQTQTVVGPVLVDVLSNSQHRQTHRSRTDPFLDAWTSNQGTRSIPIQLKQQNQRTQYAHQQVWQNSPQQVQSRPRPSVQSHSGSKSQHFQSQGIHSPRGYTQTVQTALKQRPEMLNIQNAYGHTPTIHTTLNRWQDLPQTQNSQHMVMNQRIELQQRGSGHGPTLIQRTELPQTHSGHVQTIHYPVNNANQLPQKQTDHAQTMNAAANPKKVHTQTIFNSQNVVNVQNRATSTHQQQQQQQLQQQQQQQQQKNKMISLVNQAQTVQTELKKQVDSMAASGHSSATINAAKSKLSFFDDLVSKFRSEFEKMMSTMFGVQKSAPASRASPVAPPLQPMALPVVPAASGAVPVASRPDQVRALFAPRAALLAPSPAQMAVQQVPLPAQSTSLLAAPPASRSAPLAPPPAPSSAVVAVAPVQPVQPVQPPIYSPIVPMQQSTNNNTQSATTTIQTTTAMQKVSATLPPPTVSAQSASTASGWTATAQAKSAGAAGEGQGATVVIAQNGSVMGQNGTGNGTKQTDNGQGQNGNGNGQETVFETTTGANVVSVSTPDTTTMVSEIVELRRSLKRVKAELRKVRKARRRNGTGLREMENSYGKEESNGFHDNIYVTTGTPPAPAGNKAAAPVRMLGNTPFLDIDALMDMMERGVVPPPKYYNMLNQVDPSRIGQPGGPPASLLMDPDMMADMLEAKAIANRLMAQKGMAVPHA